MTMRINVNSLKNAVGTVFLLATAFFVCSTFISMRSVFADPIAPSNNAMVARSGRVSPRSNATTASSRNVSRSTVSRGGGAVSNIGAKTVTSRGVGTRSVSGRSITPTRANNAAPVVTRGVVSRVGGASTVTTRGSSDVRPVVTRDVATVSARGSNNRAVRARTASTQSRVGVTGTTIPATRASSVTYLSNRLYTGSYANIIDSSTGLIAADAYSNCLESYYTCMDEICTARNATKGRCSCAGRAKNFLVAEEALESANEELITLSGQLSLLLATKGKGEDLQYAFSLTDAEKVMNCVSWKEMSAQYGTDYSKDEVKNWCHSHGMYNQTDCKQPDYCSAAGNNFGFDIKNINGSGSDILAQLKAWADAKDLAKEYTIKDDDKVVVATKSINKYLDGLPGVSSENTDVSVDSLANKWGYDLFQYAHNNVCGRVLDSCFNGIYEACGTPPTTTVDGKKVHTKCANSTSGSSTNCPFNYNSYISVNDGEVVLNDRSTNSTSSVNTAACFGYSGTTTTSTTRSGITSTTSDPYSSFRGPVADARRSIMQKYLLDANAACDTYGAGLRQTAQNINYQKIAAEQALQQKRLEFKQEADSTRFANATAAMENFTKCIDEIWECYGEYKEEDWTTTRIKTYCSLPSQVPHCFETMICSPLQSQLVAVVDKPDSTQCSYSNDYDINNCRNVVTINEILYGTGTNASPDLDNWNGIGTITLNSAAVREQCLERSLNCTSNGATGAECLRHWNKTDNETIYNGPGTLGNNSNAGRTYLSGNILDRIHAERAYAVSDSAGNITYQIESCEDDYILIDGECLEKTVDCTSDIVNAAKAEKTRDANGDFGDCTLVSCNDNYNKVNNQCVAKTVACEPEDLGDFPNAKSGEKTWTGSGWGECRITECHEGFGVSNNQCKPLEDD